MLEIRHVTKTYRSKTGETVRALDDISISFPEAGMVFILGKSGSGKSTLLNAIGGLDSIDAGEFVIMGKSSADFAGSDFDAYRNTFIGFIFQEYNILDEFTVGANIALALELQGKKATNEQINDILGQVDMLSFAKRKPNELSGGQKQRIAIARALVKDPQIIMADEPTGALDSNTGKQIFDTLKQLSKEKLVLVVSHDRDFAERYADRIVELADGHIISDVTKHTVEGKTLGDGIRQVSPHILQIKQGYRLTPSDVEMINDYLATNADGVILSGDGRLNSELRSAAGITDDGGTTVFEKTDPEKDVSVKQYDGKKTKFIRSSLPLKNAVKIGASGLKYKRFRLVLTILLSLVSFAMFGLADTMAAYNKTTAATSSILDSHVNGAVFTLSVKTVQHSGSYSYTYYTPANMNDDDLAQLSRETGLSFYPVYGSRFDLSGMMASRDSLSGAYEGQLYGLTALRAEDVAAAGLSLIGRMPESRDEIVISEFLYRQFKTTGFRNEHIGESVEANQLTTDAGGTPNSIIGKHLTISAGSTTTDYKVVGVVDTHFDYDRYAAFLPKDNASSAAPGGNTLSDMLLQAELSDTLRYGFHTLGFVSQDAMAGIATTTSDSTDYGIYIPRMSANDGVGVISAADRSNRLMDVYLMGGSDILPFLNVNWFDGHHALGENEYLVHEDLLDILYSGLSAVPDVRALDEKSIALFGEANFNAAKEMARSNGESYEEIVQRLAQNAEMSDEALMAEYLPVLADLYGLTIRDNTPAKAKECLFAQLGAIPLSPYGATTATFYDSVSAALLDFYCRQSIADGDLLNDRAFLDMVKGWTGVDLSALSEEAKWEPARDCYSEYLRYNESTNAFGTRTYRQLKNEARQQYRRMTGVNEEALASSLTLDVVLADKNILQHDWKLVGTFDGKDPDRLIVSDTLVSEIKAWRAEDPDAAGWGWTETAPHTAGYWASAIAVMPRDRGAVEKLVQLSYREGEDLQFSLQNSVMFTLSNFNGFIETGASVFLYIGIGFAVFSGLLLMNFISLSIAHKKREIGILRAVGARSSDVYKIFFSESLIIALINYVLAVVATLFIIFYINRWMYSEGIRITLLTFGIRQAGLMLLISVVVAALASFLPVWKIARKKPVDAIKNR